MRVEPACYNNEESVLLRGNSANCAVNSTNKNPGETLLSDEDLTINEDCGSSEEVLVVPDAAGLLTEIYY